MQGKARRQFQRVLNYKMTNEPSMLHKPSDPCNMVATNLITSWTRLLRGPAFVHLTSSVIMSSSVGDGPSCSSAAGTESHLTTMPGATGQHAVAATAGHLGGLNLCSSSTSSSDPPGMRAKVHCFTEQAPDATVHFQVIDLGLQLYIWVAVGGAKLQNMYLAIQSKQNPVPSVATLLPDATSTAASSMAQRIARRVGRPVVCSCNLPQNSDTLQVIAERRLIQELKTLGLTADTAAASTT